MALHKIIDATTGEVTVVDGPEDAAPETPASLKAYAAQKRWEREQGGIVLNGMAVRTDTTSMFKIRELKDNVAAGIVPSPFGFKAESGWVDVDLATIDAIYLAIVAHVQSGYSVERQVTEKVDSGQITTTAEIDAAFVTP